MMVPVVLLKWFYLGNFKEFTQEQESSTLQGAMKVDGQGQKEKNQDGGKEERSVSGGGGKEVRD